MPKNKYSIRKVAILGSGTMGSQIAAHCVNAGLKVMLLDLKDDGDNPNKTVEENIKKLKKMNPDPLGLPEYAGRIQPGNFEDDLDEAVSDADWVCEAIVEKMDIKKNMMSRIEKVRNKGTIISSNTSGLPIGDIGEDCSEEFQKHFLGTHFFNPPRYMKLLEVIPTGTTSAEVVEFMT
ncbi:MAG: 3-hydroxyacyl-CoA dehydrogenase family protein, partial [Candidatus Halalkalibacterium sp. M3_1C_030]